MGQRYDENYIPIVEDSGKVSSQDFIKNLGDTLGSTTGSITDTVKSFVKDLRFFDFVKVYLLLKLFRVK